MRLDHFKDTLKTRQQLISFKEEVISGWKMISDREIKGGSFGEFSIENGVGMLEKSVVYMLFKVKRILTSSLGILEGNLVTELTPVQKELGYVHTGFVAIKSTVRIISKHYLLSLGASNLLFRKL